MNEPNIPAVEITRASMLADKLEGSERLKKWLVRLFVILLILIFLGFLAWGVNKVLLTEGTQLLPEEYGIGVSPSPETGEEAVALLKRLTALAIDENKTKLTVRTSLEIDKDSIHIDGDKDGLMREAALYMKDTILENLSSYNKEKSADFGEPLTGLLPSVRFNASELKSWTSTEDGNNRTMTFDFSSSAFESVVEDVALSVGMIGADEFISYVGEQIRPVALISNPTITCTTLSVTATENCQNDQLNNITQTREYYIDASVRFTGELESLGTHRVSFVFTSKTDYAFTWAGVSLSHTMLWMEKGKTEVIEAKRTADETLEVKWSSSDASVASVDAEGYVEGHKTSPEPVTITATVEYLGNTYTADCLVYIVVPVKEVKLNTQELSLNVGKTAVLTPAVLPEKATVKDVRWFTTDETVATVDSNGTVTALKTGSCKVYCITLSGNYKRSCVVTITE